MGVKTAFAKRLRELRGDMTQAEFAEVIGISRGSVSFYENEERTADIEVLSSISKKFNVSVDYLLGNTEIKNNDHQVVFNEELTELAYFLNKYEKDRMTRRLLDLFNEAEKNKIDEDYIPNISRLLELLSEQVKTAFNSVGDISEFVKYVDNNFDQEKKSKTIVNFVFGTITTACERITKAIINQVEALPPIVIGRLIDQANDLIQDKGEGDLQ